MFPRQITASLRADLEQSNKIIILYGPRQVGKTTLVKSLIHQNPDALSVNADQMQYNDVFSSRDLRKMQELIGNKSLLFIDEAQNIKDIGINLKILHDEMPALKIIVTGSSSLELANTMQEPLTGRTKTYRLYPIAVEEIIQRGSVFEFRNQLENIMRFGAYPEILETTSPEDKIDRLNELSRAYLYKDILQLSGIRFADKLRKLLQLLAFQVGSPVSVNELARALGMSQETVEHYIDLLEKGFVLFRLGAYSSNLRKEITKMNKIYFYDLGIRNALINNFNSPEMRTDTGALWENFLIVERLKQLHYTRASVNTYFWRTYTGVELDYIEQSGDQLTGYEIKWGKPGKWPAAWREHYPAAAFESLTRENYLEFLRADAR